MKLYQLQIQIQCKCKWSFWFTCDLVRPFVCLFVCSARSWDFMIDNKIIFSKINIILLAPSWRGRAYTNTIGPLCRSSNFNLIFSLDANHVSLREIDWFWALQNAQTSYKTVQNYSLLVQHFIRPSVGFSRNDGRPSSSHELFARAFWFPSGANCVSFACVFV